MIWLQRLLATLKSDPVRDYQRGKELLARRLRSPEISPGTPGGESAKSK